jgi:hypothetical protein
VDTRRRIDLCTCGKPREDRVHNDLDPAYHAEGHTFMPNPQPSPLPPAPPLYHRSHAVRINNVWVTEVYGSGKMGHGQAKEWLPAVNAAIEDLKEKEDKS